MSKVKDILEFLSMNDLSSDNLNKYVTDSLKNNIVKLNVFRETLQNEYNLIINPLKRQIGSLDEDGILNKSQMKIIFKDIDKLDKLHKDYVNQFKILEKILFNFQNKLNINSSGNYDIYSIENPDG